MPLQNCRTIVSRGEDPTVAWYIYLSAFSISTNKKMVHFV